MALGRPLQWRHPEHLLVSQYQSGAAVESLYPALSGFDQVEWMMLMDTLNFMVDDVLVKLDRASMASSLEVGAPFLDPEVFPLPGACHWI
jgi:asparagine synthase (glutamine-hydrolysing)